MRTTPTPLGDKIRLMAAQRNLAGQSERAEGLVDAANLIDEESSLLTGKPLAELIGRIVADKLEEFVADVVSAIRTESATAPKPLARVAKHAASHASSLLEPSMQRRFIKSHTFSIGRDVVIATDLPKGEHKVLIAIVQHGPDFVPRDMVTALTGYKKQTRDTYILRLSQRGYVVTETGKGAKTTEAGVKAAGPFERLPTGKDLIDWWLTRLPEGEARIFKYVVDFYPHVVERTQIDAATGYKKQTRDAYIFRLMAKRLLVRSGVGHVEASQHLFTKGKRR